MNEQHKPKPEPLKYDIELREPWLSIQAGGWIMLILIAIIAILCWTSIF